MKPKHSSIAKIKPTSENTTPNNLGVKFMKSGKKLKIIGIIFSGVFSCAVWADNLEVHNSNEMLSSVHLERKQVEKIVDLMVKSGRLTNEEGEKARREIASVKESDIDEIKNEAIKRLSNSKN
jgi:hypothetical protein